MCSFLYTSEFSAHESEKSVDIFGKIRHLKIRHSARDTKDDERGRGASIASPFNDTFEEKESRREFQKRSGTEKFDEESRGRRFFFVFVFFDGENNGDVEPRDDDFDVYVHVYGCHVRNEKR